MAIPCVRVGDVQPCPATTPQPHGIATVIAGSPTVIVVGQPAAHLGSALVCASAPAPNAVTAASTTVFVNGQGAARTGDATSHGGVLLSGQGTVLVGD